MPRANKRAPGIPAPEANANGHDHAENAADSSVRRAFEGWTPPIQETLFDLEDISPPTDPPDAEGTGLERAYARRCADALGSYLLDHPTATLERALAAAGLTPPPGARLCVVHPLAARWALRDGLAELSGGATRAVSPQANAGLVRVYRRPSVGVVSRRVVKGAKE